MVSAFGGDLILGAVREGLALVLLVAAPPVLACVVVGLVVGVLQSATQVHDPALAFVPKLVAVVLVLAAVGAVLGAQVVRFAQSLLQVIPTLR
jgi:flagellar biosynthetic protein FliQ